MTEKHGRERVIHVGASNLFNSMYMYICSVLSIKAGGIAAGFPVVVNLRLYRIHIYYIDSEEISGFLLCLKSDIFITHSYEDIIFIFLM